MQTKKYLDTRYLIRNKCLSKSNISWHPAEVQLLSKAFSNSSCSNVLSLKQFRRSTSICPTVLKNRSTGADEGNVTPKIPFTFGYLDHI